MDNVLQWGKKLFALNKIKDRKNVDAYKADEHIYYCQSCRRCWERSKQTTKYHIEYYEDFVTYGKERKICNLCTPDKNVEE